jgi:hypothetical protein
MSGSQLHRHGLVRNWRLTLERREPESIGKHGAVW